MADQQNKPNDNFDIVVLKFADSKVPEFKEVRNKDFVLCGADNDYPEYLIYQYNKCGKHRAIINGKSRYILGSGLDKKNPTQGGFSSFTNPDETVIPATSVNDLGETMFDILKKSVKDIEIHAGFRWFITWNLAGKIADIKHEDFYRFRTGKEGGFYWKEKWKEENGSNTREEPVHYDEFSGKPPVVPAGISDDEKKKYYTQVFAYNEYGPGTGAYPLPEYIGCANYIDVDIEISKFHLSAIRNGMMPSKMIQFYTGEPSEDKKKEVERRFQKKFSGSENAGKFVLVFNSDKNKSVEINDLSDSQLDKMFDILGKTCQQEIFTGHQVVSPMLFGIKTEGQLGGNTELKTAYEIFINTYAKPKQENIERIVNYFGGLMGKGNDYYITQLDPVGTMFNIADVVDLLPKSFIYEKVGVPKEYWNEPPVNPQSPNQPVQQEQNSVNENLKNLTAKQHQQVMRIIREYNKGKITKAAASAMLKMGYGMKEDDIEFFLEDDDESTQGFSESEDDTIKVFSAFGDLKSDYHIVKTKSIKFSSDEDAAADELNFFKQAFKDAKLTKSESDILDLISKDKRVTPEVIAETIGATPEYVTTKIASLTKRGLLTSKTESIGSDVQIERELTKPLKDISGLDGDNDITEIYIKYSYEVKPGIGPAIIENTRDFCIKLLKMNRLYSRADIEKISQRLGYSVFERKGGWWGKNPECRHRWLSHVVVKKK